MNEFENKSVNPNSDEASDQNTPSASVPSDPAGYSSTEEESYNSTNEFENKSVNPNSDEASDQNMQSASIPSEPVNYSSAVKGAETIAPPVYEVKSQPSGSNYYQNSTYSQNPSYNKTAYNYSTGASYQPSSAKKPKHSGKTAIILVLALLLGLCGGVAGTFLARAITGTTGSVVLWKTADTSDTKSSADGSEKTVADVAAGCSASVVEITTESVQTGSFFGNYVSSGAGSGIIVSNDGYIATNNHVIDGAQKVTITLKSGKDYTAKIIGTDEKTDMALLKIDAENLTPVVMADSDKLVAGEQIVVIGNPLGELGGSVTTGIISATDREVTVQNETMRLLQIDAAVNPGNSGGALFNMNGELVGVVNAKYASEEVEGLGFAIPVNTAKSTIDDLLEYGYVKGRAQLGITAIEISDAQTALSAGVTELGVYVYSVNEGSGAAKAGLQAGDRIVSIDGTEISTYAELSKILESKNVGDTVELKLKRSGKEISASFKLTEYNPNTQTTSEEATTKAQSFSYYGW